MGERINVADALIEFGFLAMAQENNHLRAAQLCGAAEVLLIPTGYVPPQSDSARYDQAISEIREALGEEAYAIAWAEGQAMTWEQAVEYALEPTPA